MELDFKFNVSMGSSYYPWINETGVSAIEGISDDVLDMRLDFPVSVRERKCNVQHLCFYKRGVTDFWRGTTDYGRAGGVGFDYSSMEKCMTLVIDTHNVGDCEEPHYFTLETSVAPIPIVKTHKFLTSEEYYVPLYYFLDDDYYDKQMTYRDVVQLFSGHNFIDIRPVVTSIWGYLSLTLR